ncbi:MAG: Gfo/Idh/MocA family oxidoreductase [Alphaproteobacteria bacterium]|nr:Gfo/Idh/MocA family oxidoreductase [Alphaproteobacteria bacterium]
MTLRLGLVGLGQIARNRHVPSIAASADFTLAALADPRGGDAVAGVAIARDHRAMLADASIDAVVICTPPAARFAIAREALLAGKHVVLEKPPAATMGEAAALAQLAAREKRVLFATWHSQYNNAVEEARRFLAGKKLASFRVDWNEDFRKYHPDQSWIWESVGLGVFDMGVNALSVISRLFANPPFVRAAELRIAENHAAPLSAVLHFASLDGDGAMEMHMDWGHTGPDQREIRIATQCGHSLELLESGGKLVIDGVVAVEEKRAEYPMLYARFAELVARGRSDVDLVPLQMTLDALALGRRTVLPRFDG